MYSRAIFALTILILLFASTGCRRVTIVSNSIVHGACAEAVESKLNNNNQESWVYTKHIWPGTKAYSNPVNHEIYSKGVVDAFGKPDVVVLSFSTNDMIGVSFDQISFESAVQSMQTLINQAVAAGANCVVLLEASHRFYGGPFPGEPFRSNMDRWFDHWHSLDRDKQFLGIPYQFLIADISDEIHANPTKYLADFIHLSADGAELAAQAIVDQVNRCPEGRWIFGDYILKPNAKYPKNPYTEYVIP